MSALWVPTHEANLRGAAIDIDHHPAFDLTTAAGFVFPSRRVVNIFYFIYIYIIYLCKPFVGKMAPLNLGPFHGRCNSFHIC